MKNCIYIKQAVWLGAILLSLSTAISCKKLIEIPTNPTNAIPTATVFGDSTDVMGAVAGVYNNFSTSSSISFGSGLITLTTGLSSDELIPAATANAGYTQFYQNAVLPNNTAPQLLWLTSYKPLYQINACFDGISASTGISGGLKQQLIGEIEVARALYYFNLVNLFGAVPLVTSTDVLTTNSLPRAPVDEIYNQVLTDLLDAQKKLTAKYPSAGRARPNIFTANALLAKVYLFRGDWQKAFNMSNMVINSGLYKLNTNLSSVYLTGSTEAIWQLPAKSAAFQTAEAFNLVPNNFRGAVFNVIPTYSLSSYLFNAFEPGDQRFDNWVGKSTVTVNGSPRVYYFPFKYKNIAPTSPTTEDYMILRLSEQYLIRAEAQARLNNLPDAIKDLNIVRNRAGLTSTTAVTQSDIINAIMHERQVELFCEWGSRWFDLKRTDTIDAVLGAEKPTWKPVAAVYPIPFTEIQNNPFLKQNPGY